jgi:hypothetical protein
MHAFLSLIKMDYLIMKKIIKFTLLATLFGTSVAYAGGMGDTSCNGSNCGSAFFALEGGYTWPSVGRSEFILVGTTTTVSVARKTQGYTVRLSAGMISMLDDQIGFTGELGWGYYGRTTSTGTTAGTVLTPAQGNFTVKNSLGGFDALVGIAYVQPYFDLFLKAGALIESMDTHTQANIAGLAFPLLDTLDTKTTVTAVLPELKFGIGYNFNDNWAITGSYFVAVGSSPKSVSTFDVNTLRATTVSNTRAPTLNGLLIGIQYTV